MEVKVVANCQYYENYNVGPDGFGEVPYWKPKGGHTFEMPIDSDVVMYCDSDVLDEAINNLVKKQNTIAEKFEVIDYDVVFRQPSIVVGLGSEINDLTLN